MTLIQPFFLRVERENFYACIYHFIERNILHVNKCFLTFFAVVSNKLNFILQEVEWLSLIFLNIVDSHFRPLQDPSKVICSAFPLHYV